LVKYPKIVGIINVTPDSFSDGGKLFDKNKAIEYALEIFEKGVDIIDIGGESTKPGAEEVPFAEEIERTLPIIEGIISFSPNAFISIDTRKSQVASSALDAGASIVNDVSGGTFDKDIWKVTAEKKADYILMHTTGIPSVMQNNINYKNAVDEILNDLLCKAGKAKSLGIQKVILDPGIGFGKTVEQNLEIISRIKEFTVHGYEVMIGLSRKSFIGKYFDLEVDKRDFHTSIYEFFAIMRDVSYIRTHNVNNALALKQIWNSLNV
jgi:dihydropteroate synthase